MKRILIIEDDTVTVKVLQEKFMGDDWDVSIASDGQVAKEKLEEQSYDLILLDIMLPWANGFEVLASLKQGDKNASTPVIVLSNLDSDEEKKKTLELGATDYVSKSSLIGEQVFVIASRLLKNTRMNR